MRGVGGPLLTIGDLLSDLAVDGGADLAGGEVSVPSSPSSAGQQAEEADPSELNRLFGEHYDNLMKALQENDPSWPSLMLKLCTALKTADKLVSCASIDAEQLLQKVELLERLLVRGDRAVTAIVEELQRSRPSEDSHSSKSKPSGK
ncbi:uncharacterized LOC4329714 [Oryza sativa Japonica Group]|uniref:Os02g0567000 protein n=3 Tax=Oryza TaxID=4527 RepID=Q6YTI4_ORYSJ|nr:uncharacterized LOC4329714 [Oryza sativa Japonica Group]KAB8087557.1 hypothetical protein EE612_011868 [Oryza sativa]EEE57220.1 hypothetical protein OsJ_07191 [Oryza sativa Japonica Group]KAF2945397.1 hypothetical protein DAI22_02g213900 [Oryza sativa Japonica Group]BAD17753.1 unknown protein [Oryza sativa Japonica Group]BAF09090.1 Os02g0567000 [Oryza sativa Japonica Group]|eukprot:NP_001047176.1 Os02g0567000 [Oryza sativa Japonica Group]